MMSLIELSHSQVSNTVMVFGVFLHHSKWYKHIKTSGKLQNGSSQDPHSAQWHSLNRSRSWKQLQLLTAEESDLLLIGWNSRRRRRSLPCHVMSGLFSRCVHSLLQPDWGGKQDVLVEMLRSDTEVRMKDIQTCWAAAAAVARGAAKHCGPPESERW